MCKWKVSNINIFKLNLATFKKYNKRNVLMQTSLFYLINMSTGSGSFVLAGLDAWVVPSGEQGLL